MHIFGLFNKNGSGLIALPPLSHTRSPTTEAFLIPWYEFLCSLLTEVRVLSHQPLRRQLLESRNRHWSLRLPNVSFSAEHRWQSLGDEVPDTITTFVRFLTKTLYARNLIFCPTFVLLTLNCHPPRRYIWKTSVNNLLKSEQAHNCVFEGKKYKPNIVSDSQS